MSAPQGPKRLFTDGNSLSVFKVRFEVWLAQSKITLFQCTVTMNFEKCVQSCNHHHKQDTEHFCHPKDLSPATLWSVSCPHTETSSKHSYFFHYYKFAFCTIYRLLSFASFTEYDFAIHLCYSMFKYFVLFYCMNVLQFVYSFTG